MNNCVQDAAQIQNQIRLIMAIREPRAVINFRHPFLKQISGTGLSYEVDVDRWYQLVEIRSLKCNAMLGEKVMIDDPFIPGWRIGIQSAKSPPRSRCCRRPQIAHEFERNVGALNPICPPGTAALYLSVQLFNRSEFIFRQWTPNDCLQVYIASFWHEIPIGQRAGQIQPDNLVAEQALHSICPLGQHSVDRRIWSYVVHLPTPPYES